MTLHRLARVSIGAPPHTDAVRAFDRDLGRAGIAPGRLASDGGGEPLRIAAGTRRLSRVVARGAA
jgi:hypothetical protein